MTEFVARLGTTPGRKQLCRNLISYRKLLAGDGYTEGFQFIDGSFVEDVERTRGKEPSDLDVFSFLSAPLKYQQDFSAWNAAGLPFWRTEIADRDRNKARFGLDTYALLLQETNLPTLIQQIIYWYGLFSHQRETFAWKGFVAIPLDPSGDDAALGSLGVA
jgi:hypothetical protein